MEVEGLEVHHLEFQAGTMEEVAMEVEEAKDVVMEEVNVEVGEEEDF